MATTYKQKLLGEINAVPEDMLPRFYRVIHTLRTEMMREAAQTTARGSLRGIWGSVTVDDALFDEARRSLFTYELKSGKH